MPEHPSPNVLYTNVTQAQRAPTLRDVMKQAAFHESDRVSLMSEPTAEKPAGLVVLLIGKDAIDDIKPVLMQVAQRLGEVKADQKFAMKFDDDAKHILQWLLESRIPWTYGAFKYEDKVCMIFGLVGTEVCFDMATTLTNLGLPTSFR